MEGEPESLFVADHHQLSPSPSKQPCRRILHQPPQNLPVDPVEPSAAAAAVGYLLSGPGATAAVHSYPAYAKPPFKPPANCY